MNNVNWGKVLIRCSCIGKIMASGKGSGITDLQLTRIAELQAKDPLKITEKQTEELSSLIAKRDAPPVLGDTCISYLKEVYIWEKYGKESVGGSERSKYTKKGQLVEDQSIMLLSRLDSMSYKKNTEFLKNEFIKGTPDIIIGDDIYNAKKIIDTKSSWDFATLLSNYGSPLNPLYWWQIQGYCALTNSPEASVDYCLVSMPQEFIEGEKRRLFYAMNPATEENLEYKKAVERMENNYTFDEVPIKERRISFPVKRDEEAIKKVYEKVKECRKWLADFEKAHLGT